MIPPGRSKDKITSKFNLPQIQTNALYYWLLDDRTTLRHPHTCPTQHKDKLLLYCTIPNKLLYFVLFNVCIDGLSCYLKLQNNSPCFLGFSSRYTSFNSWLVSYIMNLALFFCCLTSQNSFPLIFPTTPPFPFKISSCIMAREFKLNFFS
jgi:hypothetical protein